MTKRLLTALVALLVIVGFTFPASAAPIDASPEPGISHRVAKLVDTILDSLAAVLPGEEGAVAKSGSDGEGTTGTSRDGGFDRMLMGLEPNG